MPGDLQARSTSSSDTIARSKYLGAGVNNTDSGIEACKGKDRALHESRIVCGLATLYSQMWMNTDRLWMCKSLSLAVTSLAVEDGLKLYVDGVYVK